MVTQEDLVVNLTHATLVVDGKMREVGYRFLLDDNGAAIDILPYFRAEDQFDAALLPTELNWTLQ